MSIEDFCRDHGQGARPAVEALQAWRAAQIDQLIENAIAAGVLLTDAVMGDGLRDQISRQLLDGFSELMGGKADSYGEVRKLLLEKLEAGEPSARGLVLKIQGQIGENQFAKEVGSGAYLAESGSQEAWDVAVPRPDGTQYVQVKTVQDPSSVVREMREVQAKVEAGTIFDEDTAVRHIDFAVPENIAEDVKRLASVHPELGQSEVLSIGMSSTEAGDVVREGLNNLNEEAIEHFLGELLGGVAVAGSLHAAANAFLMYKGAKTVEEALADTTLATGITSLGVGVGLTVEAVLSDLAVLAGPAGVILGAGTRVFVSLVARSRWQFADYLEASNQQMDFLIRRLSGSTA